MSKVQIMPGLKVKFHGDFAPAILAATFEIDVCDILRETATGRILLTVRVKALGEWHRRKTYADNLRTVDGHELTVGDPARPRRTRCARKIGA